MSNSNYNKIISTINSVSSGYSYVPDPNNLICIDSSNNRIGINTLNPMYSIDASGGTIKAENFIANKNLLVNGDASFNNNVEISGNIISKNIIPFDNSFTLGNITKVWKNAYINDLSVNNDLTVNNNLTVNKELHLTKNTDSGLFFDNSNVLYFNNTDSKYHFTGDFFFETPPAYPNGLAPTTTSTANTNGGTIASVSITSSTINSSTIGNSYPSTGVFTDLSVNNNLAISGTITSKNILPVTDISFDLGSSSKKFRNAYINDLSVNNNLDVSGTINSKNILPVTNISFDLGSSSKKFRNAYINDLSVNNNLDVSGTINSKNILPVLNNTFDLGSSSKKFKNAYITDLSVNNNLDVSGTITSKNILPVTNISFDLGSSSKKFRNAYINDLSVNNNLDVSGSVKFNYSSAPTLTPESIGYTYRPVWNISAGNYSFGPIPRSYSGSGDSNPIYYNYNLVSGTPYMVFTLNNLPIGTYIAHLHIDINSVNPNAGAIHAYMVNHNAVIAHRYITNFYGTPSGTADYGIEITKIFQQTIVGGNTESNNFRITFYNNANRTATYYAFSYPYNAPYLEIIRIA